MILEPSKTTSTARMRTTTVHGSRREQKRDVITDHCLSRLRPSPSDYEGLKRAQTGSHSEAGVKVSMAIPIQKRLEPRKRRECGSVTASDNPTNGSVSSYACEVCPELREKPFGAWRASVLSLREEPGTGLPREFAKKLQRPNTKEDPSISITRQFSRELRSFKHQKNVV